MSTPRALLLYDEVPAREAVSAAIVGEVGEVDQARLYVSEAPQDLYCLVVLSLECVTPSALVLIRAWGQDAPRAMLMVATAQTTRANRVAILEAGVDSFIVWPIGAPELRARIRAAVRRSQAENGPFLDGAAGG